MENTNKFTFEKGKLSGPWSHQFDRSKMGEGEEFAKAIKKHFALGGAGVTSKLSQMSLYITQLKSHEAQYDGVEATFWWAGYSEAASSQITLKGTHNNAE